MTEYLPEEQQPAENSEEYNRFEKLVKTAFSMPKSEIEKAEQQESKNVTPPTPYQKK